MKKSPIISLLAGIAILGVLTVLAVVPLRTVNVSSRATYDFVIDQPMVRVRKILVRTNAVKKIVAMADAKLVDQQWLNMRLQLERLILDPNFDLHGDGQLVVLTNNNYLGKHEITLDQQINITRFKLSAASQLKQPVGPFQKYQSTLTLVPDDSGNARFESTLELQIETTASWLMSGFVEAGIRAAAGDSLKLQEKALREVVASEDGKLIILPDAG